MNKLTDLIDKIETAEAITDLIQMGLVQVFLDTDGQYHLTTAGSELPPGAVRVDNITTNELIELLVRERK